MSIASAERPDFEAMDGIANIHGKINPAEFAAGIHIVQRDRGG
jgi:hypothetical protein